MNTDYFTIGKLAKETDTKVVTIRYYESIGLLPAPLRTGHNYRLYNRDHFKRLSFIRRCRSLGFPLSQIREIIALTDQPDEDCQKVDKIARGHLDIIESKIQDLTQLASELRQKITACQGGTIAQCCILKNLSKQNNNAHKINFIKKTGR